MQSIQDSNRRQLTTSFNFDDPIFHHLVCIRTTQSDIDVDYGSVHDHDAPLFPGNEVGVVKKMEEPDKNHTERDHGWTFHASAREKGDFLG